MPRKPGRGHARDQGDRRHLEGSQTTAALTEAAAEDDVTELLHPLLDQRGGDLGKA
jgi:hypothetical protein